MGRDGVLEVGLQGLQVCGRGADGGLGGAASRPQRQVCLAGGSGPHGQPHAVLGQAGSPLGPREVGLGLRMTTASAASAGS